jgi:hypothetical protein
MKVHLASEQQVQIPVTEIVLKNPFLDTLHLTPAKMFRQQDAKKRKEIAMPRKPRMYLPDIPQSGSSFD